MYSNPPVHGARIMARIIGNPDNFAAWRAELKAVADRIKAMRKLLLEKLVANGAPGNWDHIVSQIGMFSFTGLTRNRDIIRNLNNV
jgi:aspartate/tyrosine/aromatic aminotransferase